MTHTAHDSTALKQANRCRVQVPSSSNAARKIGPTHREKLPRSNSIRR